MKKSLIWFLVACFIVGSLSTPVVASDTDTLGWWYSPDLTCRFSEYVFDYSMCYNGYFYAIQHWNTAKNAQGTKNLQDVFTLSIDQYASVVDIEMGVINAPALPSAGASDDSHYSVNDEVIVNGYIDLNIGHSGLATATTFRYAQSVAAHEIGHRYGLAHNNIASSIMYVNRSRVSVYEASSADGEDVEAWYARWNFETWENEQVR